MSKEVSISVSQGDDDDIFANLPPLDPFDVKKDELAANLAALMHYGSLTRKSLATKLNWKPSRISHVLSGRANPTFLTIFEYCRAIGFDFDIVFRRPEQQRSPQPWYEYACSVMPERVTTPVTMFIVQTRDDVAEDFQAGRAASIYLKVLSGVPTSPSTSSISEHSVPIIGGTSSSYFPSFHRFQESTPGIENVYCSQE